LIKSKGNGEYATPAVIMHVVGRIKCTVETIMDRKEEEGITLASLAQGAFHV
jgi:hypothetical protein